MLSQLSYAPMGLSGLEPPTSRLSGVRSNRLSYKPKQKYLATTYSHRQSPVYYLRPLTPSLLCSIWIQVFPISASSPGKIHKFYNPQSIPQEKTQNRIIIILQNSLKGGDPATPSDTATLLRLHPSH